MLRTVSTTDYHTAGEPFRIVADPPVPLPGVSVADRRVRATESPDAQGLRELLCFEPRGHADMYGGFLVPADDDGAHLGVLFWHKDGFSTACGHGTIALGAWAVDTGLVQAPRDGSADVVIDVPSGRVTARVHRDRGRTVAVDFVNVPSYVLAPGIALSNRSPCGSGTCARLAVLADQGRVSPRGPALRHESIVGSVFTGTVVAITTAADRPAVVPQVTGIAYRTGEHTFVVDPADPLVPGFVLR